MSILDAGSAFTRGVIQIGSDCEHCGRPVPVFGKVGKGRPLDTFAPDYFCGGHAIRFNA